jgi:hypothetical protein
MLVYLLVMDNSTDKSEVFTDEREKLFVRHFDALLWSIMHLQKRT